MSKFCTRCGRPLQEGEVCTCQTNINANGGMQQPTYQAQPTQQAVNQVPPMQQAAYQAQPMQQAVNQASPAQQMASQVKRSYFQLFKKPVTVGKEVIESADIKMAAMFLVLQGIASALFAIAVGAKVDGIISSLISDFESYGSVVSNTLSVPYIRIVCSTVILSIAFSCLLALLLWVGHMVIKCQTTYQKMLSAAAIRSAVMLPTILVSVILLEIDMVLGFFLFIVGNAWGFFAIISALLALIPDEKKDIFPLIMGVIVLLFIIVVLFIMSKTWTLYLPDALRKAIDLANGGISSLTDLSDLIEKMLY